jgi:hypothetical protein
MKDNRRRLAGLISIVTVFVAFVGCSQHKSQFSAVPDLGVVYFSDHPKLQRLHLGGGTNCSIEAVTNYHALGMNNYLAFGASNYSGPLVYVRFQASSADRSIQGDMGWLPVELGKKSVYKAGGCSVQFTLEHRKP